MFYLLIHLKKNLSFEILFFSAIIDSKFLIILYKKDNFLHQQYDRKIIRLIYHIIIVLLEVKCILFIDICCFSKNYNFFPLKLFYREQNRVMTTWQLNTKECIKVLQFILQSLYCNEMYAVWHHWDETSHLWNLSKFFSIINISKKNHSLKENHAESKKF